MANAKYTTQPHGTVTRVVLVAMALIGAFLIALPLATNLPGKSSASANLMTAFRPVMTDQSLAQGTADQATMGAMATELNAKMVPALAAQMGMTPQQLTTYIGTTYPAVGAGLGQMGAILPFFGGLQTTMVAQQANFQQADQIPTGFLSPTSMTWLFVIPGVLLMVIAGFGLVRPRFARRMLAAGSVVGLVMGIGLLGTSMYGKASAADTMTKAFAPIFATSQVQQAVADTGTVQAMSTQFTDQAIPGIAAALKMSPTQLNTMMSQNFPAVAAGTLQLPAIVDRMSAATNLIVANVDNYNQSATIPWSGGSMVTMFWLMMVPALLVFVMGAGAFLIVGRRPTIKLAAPHAAAPRPI